MAVPSLRLELHVLVKVSLGYGGQPGGGKAYCGGALVSRTVFMQ